MQKVRSACLISISTVLALQACAFSPVARVNYDRYYNQFPRTKTVPGESSAMLDAVRSSLEGMGYPDVKVNSDLAEVRTGSLAVPTPEACDCGTWNGSPVRGTAESAVLVKVTAAASDEVQVAIEQSCGTLFRGQNLYGATTRQEAYRCASRGAVERKFWETLDRVLGARAAKKAG